MESIEMYDEQHNWTTAQQKFDRIAAALAQGKTISEAGLISSGASGDQTENSTTSDITKRKPLHKKAPTGSTQKLRSTMDKLYSTKEAAQALGITVAGLWYHIQTGNIAPAKIGRTLVFTQAQLDEFQANRKPVGRPKTKVVK